MTSNYPPKMAATGQFGDTTYTKVFVGGLAWKTQKDAVKKYFEQFGDILEAVVISEKNTGRSKGYGFVTFCEADAAMRACIDPSPVIDGRRTNCNIAYLGAHRSQHAVTLPQIINGMNRRSLKVVKSIAGAVGHVGVGMGTATCPPSLATFPHYVIHQGVPYNVFGYPPIPYECSYPTDYYTGYGGTTAQYPIYGSAAGVITGNTAFNSYFPFGQGGGAPAGYASGHGSMHYPQFLHYSAVASTTGMTVFAQNYGGTLSIASSPPSAQAALRFPIKQG